MDRNIENDMKTGIMERFLENWLYEVVLLLCCLVSVCKVH